MTTQNNRAVVTDATLIAAEAELFKRDFYLFAKAAWKHIDPAPLVVDGAWHFEAICKHLQAVADGRIKRLLINIPPGAGKSMLISVLFPAWMWTHRPTWRCVSASHSFDYAKRDTRRSRELMRSAWYQERWPIEFSDDQDQKQSYENKQRGFRVAKPFTGITGERGNCVIIDDPHSVADAKSDAERTNAVETFLEAVPSRLNNLMEDAIIVVMQRLHEADVSGVILELPGLGYEHLCIPMEYEGDKHKTCIGWKDPRKKLGELMFPKLFSKKALEQSRASLGTTSYAGQYQQRPSPADSGDIDINWFKNGRYNIGDHPKGCNFYMTSDHAVSGRGDYNVFRVWGIDSKRDLWLVDSFRAQCTLQEALGIRRTKEGQLVATQSGALHLVKLWKPLAYFPEGDNNWKAVGNMFEQAMRETGVWVRIKPQPTSGLGDKVNKAQPYCNLAALGQIHLPNGMIGELALSEYAKFPVGKHDDQVDADGMIGRVYHELRTGYIPEEGDPISRPSDYRGGRSGAQSDSDSFFI